MRQKFMIVSDSHAIDYTIRAALKAHPDIDALIHLGDSEDHCDQIREMAGVVCYMVRGNMDTMRSMLPAHEIIPAGEHLMLAVHGHMQSVHYDYSELVDMAERNGCDIALFGHLHIPVFERHGDVAVINPGSISLPRQRSSVKTYGILTVDDTGDFRYDFQSVSLKDL